MSNFLQRVRDPVHGLIKFESDTDKIAWELLETPEFQRLRRIRQLGFSEFIFPSATHTRFAHSIGVYHNARKLMKVVEKDEGTKFDKDRSAEILFASLLHDVGHGPFSHAFEKAREGIASAKSIEKIEKHEKFSAKIIRNPKGSIFPILEKERTGLAEKIAAIIEADDPTDIYHAVISSSFDADRLDYLVRDRMMTGTGIGSIDNDWLIDNLTEKLVATYQDDDPEPQMVSTFVFKFKGRQAAEDFLLARYRLYTQVYLHKTTRGFEALLSRILLLVGDANISLSSLNLSATNPLVQFLRDFETVELYLELDDFLIWDILKLLSKCRHSEACALSKRVLERDHLHVLDLFSKCGNNDEDLANAERDIVRFAETELGVSIFRDAPEINLYSEQSGEAKKLHKVVRVQDGNGKPLEITEFAETIISASLKKKRRMIRYYFLTMEKRDEAKKAIWG